MRSWALERRPDVAEKLAGVTAEGGSEEARTSNDTQLRGPKCKSSSHRAVDWSAKFMRDA